MDTIAKLSQIQSELKAPKGQKNKFGNYNYRSCEDILEAVKPHLDGGVVTLTDSVVEIGGHNYVEATATFKYGDGAEIVQGYAREAFDSKGMSPAQMTGSASSYARKYALNGLFCIDDTKDADATNTHGKEVKPVEKKPEPVLVTGKEDVPVTAKDIRGYVSVAKTEEELMDIYNQYVKPISAIGGTDYEMLMATLKTRKQIILGDK